MSPSTLYRPLLFAARPVLYRGSNLVKFSPRSTRTLLHASTKSGTTTIQPTSRAPVLFLGLITGGAFAYYFFWPSESRHAPTLSNASLSGAHFTPVTVAASEPCVDRNTRFVTLTVPRESLPSQTTLQDPPSFQAIWSVFIKDDDIQVERPYTPLEGMDKDGNMVFWIKKYEKGEVARWLHTKRPGEKVEIRGPVRTWSWQDGVWDEVVMISGGTGITPFYQLLHSTLLSQPSALQKTRFTVLHSSRTPSELPPSVILRPLLAYAEEHPERLRVSLFVDILDGSKAELAPVQSLHEGRIGEGALRRALGLCNEASWWQRVLRIAPTPPTMPQGPAGKRTLVLICGPEPMINAIAGPYGRNFSQGPVGGALGQLGCRSDQVWKL